MESDKTMFWSLMGVMSLQSNSLPGYIQQLYKLWKSYRDNLGAYSHAEFPEFEESSMGVSSEIYLSVRTYLSNLDATAKAPSVSITRSSPKAKLSFSLPSHYSIVDDFQGTKIWWTHEVNTEDKNAGAGRERGRPERKSERKYILKFFTKDRAKVLPAYVDHISDFAEEMKRRNQERKLYSNIESRSRWSWVALKNPCTFDTVALDPVLKTRVLKDLDCFKRSREFYHRIGRAWKRGYLLYGPPGTGKSSVIAAIANYMKYDVYDLELTQVMDNASLRELLLATANKSVIVIEDIDCAANLPEKVISRQPKPKTQPGDSRHRPHQTITLSGLLNFADGLWSSCGEERIMIFTTNHKDRLDPALLRCGRMDMHILLTFCEFHAFKQLVFNYLEIKDHLLFPVVEEKMQCGGRLTPAEICEILIQNTSDSDSAIQGVIAALEDRIGHGVTEHSNGESLSDSNKHTSEEEEEEEEEEEKNRL